MHERTNIETVKKNSLLRRHLPAQFNNRKTGKWFEICSKLTIETTGVSIVNFEHISHCSSIYIANFEHVITG